MKFYTWITASFICNGLSLVCVYVAFHFINTGLYAVIIAALAVFFTNLLLIKFFFGEITRFLATTELALLHLKDNELSLHLPSQKNAQLQKLANLFHNVIDSLRKERNSLLQRELLLDRVFETVSSALLLVDSRNKIALCNPAARQLLSKGKPIKGILISELFNQLPLPIAESISQQQDVLFMVDGDDGEPESWHLSCEHFTLNSQPHCLYHFKQMTHALSRAEVDTWKKVIRVLSHELNNSLAPFASLSHSGKQIVAQEKIEKNKDVLHEIFETLAERSEHLKKFLNDYAQFSRLPVPHLQPIQWHSFIKNLQTLTDFQWIEPYPFRKGLADISQLSQVFINLIKNSQEAGATAEGITINIMNQSDWDKITICDNGSGMNPEQLTQSLLPFYSTKRNGSGIGLTLCREIIDAHNGRIKLANIQEGGLQVTIWLPANKSI